MAKRKKNKKKKTEGFRIEKRPNKFHSFSDCVKLLKKSVYVIARGRKTQLQGKEAINWITLGSGFVAAPNRFLTAAHVIDNPEGEITQHKDGDKYYLLMHDDLNNFHIRVFEPKLNKDVFIYPEIDIAIIYLDDEFYQIKDKIFVNKNDFIRISKDFLPIGSEVGVLGYPLSKLEFDNQDFSHPRIANILMRTDKGVINCRYQTSKDQYLYEFTMDFNPGNSGGPIFDIKTGRVISIVKGFKSILIANKETVISNETAELFKTYKEKAFIETMNANYSFGFATPTYIEVFKKHNIFS